MDAQQASAATAGALHSARNDLAQLHAELETAHLAAEQHVTIAVSTSAAASSSAADAVATLAEAGEKLMALETELAATRAGNKHLSAEVATATATVSAMQTAQEEAAALHADVVSAAQVAELQAAEAAMSAEMSAEAAGAVLLDIQNRMAALKGAMAESSAQCAVAGEKLVTAEVSTCLETCAC